MPEILARAPTRIDLAGGTLDIWPISLLEEGACTVNVALGLEATARIIPRRDSALRIHSQDQGWNETWPRLADLRPHGKLEYLARLLRALPPPTGIDLITDCAAPAGSGLGGSSALGIAAAAALARLRGEALPPEQLLGIVQSVETQVLRVPTGVQDYYPPLLGGALVLRYGIRGTTAEPLPVSLGEIEERIVLCYSGESRSSGISNWDMLKRYLDGEPSAMHGIRQVLRATRRMEAALREQNLDAAAEALEEEWQARKTLSEKVSSPRIEELMRTARLAGAIAGKVCGAGGGGCIVFLTRSGQRESVRRALSGVGARILDTRLPAEGVRIEMTENGR
jgi:D-glycero-alpha-D-manno-heptose-7-phosphate kinase